MRRSLGRSLFAATLTVALAPLAATVHAAENEIGVLVGAAGADKEMVGPDHDYKPEWLAGIRFGHDINDDFSSFADLTWSPFTGDDALLGDVTETSLRGGSN